MNIRSVIQARNSLKKAKPLMQVMGALKRGAAQFVQIQNRTPQMAGPEGRDHDRVHS